LTVVLNGPVVILSFNLKTRDNEKEQI
jgi:hypothetical protein